MTDDEETVERAEGNRWHREEIPWRQSLPDGFGGRPASAWPGQDLSALASSNGRWSSRKVQNRACGVPHGSAVLHLQRDELLTQSEILEKETSPPTKEADQHSEAETHETKHGQDL